MELTQQMATVQDEVKLLKGEIKTILRELRTAVLSEQNPFAADTRPPSFQPVGRPATEPQQEGPEEQPADMEDEEEASRPQASLPAAPAAPPVTSQEPAATPHAGGPEPQRAQPPQPPTPIHAENEGATEPAGPPDQRWDLLTIASLAAWSEEALATLGSKRYRLVLELASFADVVSDEVREVLLGMDQLSSTAAREDERPMNINECLAVLRQLEAILQGEKVTRLPRRRARRSRSRVR